MDRERVAATLRHLGTILRHHENVPKDRMIQKMNTNPRKNSKPRIIVGLDIATPFRNYADVYRGIQQVAMQRDIDVVLNPFIQPHELAASDYDGAIVRASWTKKNATRKKCCPLVNVLHNSQWINSLPTIIPDYIQCGRLAAEHLISRGYKNFGILGYTRDKSQEEMNVGFIQELEERRLKCTYKLLVNWTAHREKQYWHSFREKLASWIGTLEFPVGLFINRDVLAHYLLNECFETGIDVPRDIGIVCTESSPYLCTSRPPTLTAIDLGFENVGKTACESLLQMIAGKPPSEQKKLIEPKGLIPRDSTASFIVGDQQVAEIIEVIQTIYTRPIGVNDLATSINLSRRTIERKVKSELGLTVNELISKIRIEIASRLLVDSDLLIKQIALKTGFVETRRLNQVFRRYIGCLPTEYRARWK